MPALAYIALGLLILWGLGHSKRSRPDATLVGRLHPYRRLMPYIMPGRNESVVYFDIYARAEPLLEYLARAEPAFGADVTQCIVAAMCRTLSENPTMNRFVVGHRLYQRNEISVTFSMKRKAGDASSKLAVVRTKLNPGEDFRSLCHRINAEITVERSDAKTYADKEYGLLHRVPRPILRAGVGALRLLDYYNLLPASFIENDAMYSSAFVANLGTLGMDAGYHHLYEWGTCSLFLMGGKIEERAVVRDGKIVAEKILHMRATYDERIDDGMTAGQGINVVTHTLENPFEYLGCLQEDGSDARPLDHGAPLADKRSSSLAA